MEVGTAQYRLRLYNVSNAKNYDFAFSDGREFTIIGTDGGLLDTPVRADHILMGAAERVEIVVDFSRDPIGTKVGLISRSFQGDMMEMGSDGGMDDMTGRVPNGVPLDVMRFDIAKSVSDTIVLYDRLPQNAEITHRLDPSQTDNIGQERQFVMTMMEMGSMGSDSKMEDDSMGSTPMIFLINDKLFDPTRVDEYAQSNSTEIWSLVNNSPMAHPFHAHAIQWQILDRNGVPASGADLGWKDTFLVQPGETVRIIGKFEPVNYGDYMYHCHILEHEDAGMMGYFRVGESGHLDDL
jgi:FtsP/CotA-like multicopper oxidase with cupredoxin domain